MLRLLVAVQLSDDSWRILHPGIRTPQNENNCVCLLYMYVYKYVSGSYSATHGMATIKQRSFWQPLERCGFQKRAKLAAGHPLRQANANLNDKLCFQGVSVEAWRSSLTASTLESCSEDIAHLHPTGAQVNDSGLGSGLSSLGGLH